MSNIRVRWRRALFLFAALITIADSVPLARPFPLPEPVPVTRAVTVRVQVSATKTLVQTLQVLPQGVIAQETAYMGVPLGEYYSRADEVYRHRVTGWYHGKSTEVGCSLWGSRCSLGLLCVGPDGMKKCRAPVADGQGCDGISQVCKETSKCIQGKCWDLVHEGGNCAAPYTQCERNLFCSEGACVQTAKEFKACGATVPCASGLVCDREMCLAEDGKAQGELCDVNKVECKRGLACAANTKFGQQPTCVISADLTHLIPCSTGCPLGFTCQRNVCWYTWDKFAYCALGSFQLCKPGLRCKKSTSSVFWTCT